MVVLGAGASLAAMPDGDRNGRRLPLMANFIDVVGLGPILDQHGLTDRAAENFEDLYSAIYDNAGHAAAVSAFEAHVHGYFANMALPDQPTIYDQLVLSLRPKDIIATFNWDPFLFEACRRNHRVAPMPRVIFLHGSVSIGLRP